MLWRHFVILLFIALCCLRGELNMPNPSEGEVLILLEI